MPVAVDNQSQVLQHVFSKGLKLDNRPEFVEADAWTYANNAVIHTQESAEFGIANELSLNECAAFPSDVIGISFVEERNWSIGIAKDGSMYKHDHRNCKQEKFFDPAEFDCDFGCTDCEKVELQFKTMDPCSELYAYFSCGCIYYKINIDLMLDEKRKNGLKKQLQCDNCADGAGCEYFKIFKCACSPKINPKAYSTGGGSLPAGAYQFVLRLKHSDGSYTNWFNHSDPVYIGSDHNRSGEPSNGHIAIDMSCLDCNFAAAEIAVIQRVGGATNAYLLETINYGNDHYTYNYTGQEGIPISITELALGSKGDTYLEGKHMKQYKSRMLYYGLRHFKNLNYQYKANSITTGFKIYEIPLEHARKYNLKGLRRGETYAFGIVWNFKDGTHSRVFHIPGVPTSGGVTSQGFSQEFEDTFNPDPGRPANSTAGGGTVTSDTEGVACEYLNTDGYDVTYSSNENILQINQIGPNGKVVDCIKECLAQEKTTIVYITDENGQFAQYSIQSIISSTNDQIKLFVSEDTQLSGNAAQVVVAHAVSNNGDGGGGSGGGGYSGQSQPNLGSNPVTIDTPRCVVRKRASIPDDINNPYLDEQNTALLEMLNEISSRAPMECEELKLIEDQRRAACCNCKEEATIYPPESCGDPGSITVTASTPEVLDEDGNVIFPGSSETSTAELPADCAAPFVCCETGPMCEEGSAYRQCVEDRQNYDQGAAAYVETLASFSEDKMNPALGATSMHDAAIMLQTAINNRERIERKAQKWTVNASSTYQKGGTDPRSEENTQFGDSYTDCCGKKDSEIEMRVIASGRTTPDFEQDIKYPCTVDCNGEFIYQGNADNRVAHHQFPGACDYPHFTSKSTGVPGGTYCPGANEMEGFVNLMAPTFDNIQWPTDSELPKPICKNNPYTIVMVKRTDSNKKILMSGMSTGTFLINEGKGKTTLHPRFGVNSFEEVSPYHNGGGCFPRLSNQGSGDAHNIWSLDGCIRKPALNIDFIREELKLTGMGERYALYARGEEPEDTWNGSRVDKKGAQQAVNMSNSVRGECTDHAIDYKIYAPARGSGIGGSIAPPQGGDKPLMQAYQQESIWVGSGLPQYTDDSFVGDVLDHNAPISEAMASYVTLRRNLANQYGALQNLNYYPILQAGKNASTSIEGIAGDTYIAPYSFVRTGWVSDRVGKCEDDDGCPGKFNIPAMVPTKEERRCVCDSPEDAIITHAGQNFSTDIPESGEAADAKNWAGLHTMPSSRTATWGEAIGQGQAISDYYYPGFVTTNITFWTESDINPYLRETGDRVTDQFYGELDPQYSLTTGVTTDTGGPSWKDTLLGQIGCEVSQPTQRQRFMKSTIRAIITVVGPLLSLGARGVDSLSAIQQYVAGGTATSFHELLNNVLYSNEQLDKLLGIPTCKTDTNSTTQSCIKGFFRNPCRYNWDYSAVNDIYAYCGMADDYYVCSCDNCKENQTSNTIYYSEEHKQGMQEDAYTIVKPLNKITIDPSEGKLTNLPTINGTLYYHTTDILRPLQHGRVALASSVGEVILGTGGFLNYTGGGGPIEGFAGLQHHNHQINSQWGYFFIDQEAAKIYKLSDQGLEEISARGGFNWFKENLPFCEETDCKNEHKAGTSFYAMGVDPRLERFFITKRDGNPSGDFTLSYDLKRGIWVSFHDYHPRIYNWDRYDGYILTDNGYWKFHKECDFGNYCGVKGKFVVEFSSSHSQYFKYKYSTVRLLTEKCIGGTWARDLDIFFDRIALYNSSQSTGYMDSEVISDNRGAITDQYDLIKENPGKIRVHKDRRCWNYNEICDIVDQDCNDCYSVLEKGSCEVHHKLNESILNCKVVNEQNYRNRRFGDKWIGHIYEYNNDDGDKQLVLISSTDYIQPE